MNSLIAAAIGGVLSILTVVGGVSAVQADPKPIPSDEIYSYADA